MNWHAHDSDLGSYIAGTTADVQAQSIEQHLNACAPCRGRLAERYDRGRMAMVWSEVVDELDQPRRPWLERVLRRLGVSEQTSRLVAATPSLRWSWFAGVLTTLAFCVFASEALGPGAPVLFFAVAPLVPLGAVAVAFGPRFDPIAELTRSAPVSSFRLLLTRTAAVLLATIPLVLLAERFLQSPAVDGARWLLPSLAMVAASLALSTRIDPLVSSAVVGGAWIALLTLMVVPVGTARVGTALAESFVFGSGGQALSLAVTLLGFLWVFFKKDTIEIRRYV